MDTTTATNPTEISGMHCQQCGSQDYEDLHCGDQGYTACCNEIAMIGCDLYFCSHGCEYTDQPNAQGDYTCTVHGKGHDR